MLNAIMAVISCYFRKFSRFGGWLCSPGWS